MAPSEFDLRVALREGEGDAPDLNKVMFAVEARRRHRARIASVAAIVAVAGGLGVAAAEFGGNGSGGAASDAALHAENGGGAAGAVGVPMAPGTKNALAQVSCPAAAPHYAVDAAPDQSGNSSYGAALFDRQVSSVVVCAYGPAFQAASDQLRAPARLELAGRQAKRVANSLENAPAAAPSASCASSSIEQYALIPVDASGKQGQPVAAQVPSSPCGALVTNGTVVRYDWRPPPAVARQLDRLSPTEPPDSPAPVASPTPSATS